MGRDEQANGRCLFLGTGFALGLIKSLHASLIFSVFATKLSIFFSSSGHQILPDPDGRHCR